MRFKKPCLPDYLQFGWKTGIHLYWLICEHKWKAYIGCGPIELLHQVFCPTLQPTIWRVNPHVVRFFAYAPLSWTGSLNAHFGVIEITPRRIQKSCNQWVHTQMRRTNNDTSIDCVLTRAEQPDRNAYKRLLIGI